MVACLCREPPEQMVCMCPAADRQLRQAPAQPGSVTATSAKPPGPASGRARVAREQSKINGVQILLPAFPCHAPHAKSDNK